jgi:hypothetical protein
MGFASTMELQAAETTWPPGWRRIAFRQSGIAALNSHGVVLEGFYLSPNDHPRTNTALAGVNTELRMFQAIQMGLTYANIFHSETAQRQGLNVIYCRAEGAVLPPIKDFYLASSFVAESNGDRGFQYIRVVYHPLIYFLSAAVAANLVLSLCLLLGRRPRRRS